MSIFYYEGPEPFGLDEGVLEFGQPNPNAQTAVHKAFFRMLGGE
jgi:hypothetical protein